MKIEMLWKDEYPWDVRVEKLGRTLRDSGHEVFIVASNRQGRLRRERIEGLEIRRLRCSSSIRLNRIVSLPASGNPFWRSESAAVCDDEEIDLLIVRDLPLLPLGVWLGRTRRIPVIFDMAELYSAMWADVAEEKPWSLSSLFLKNPKMAECMERRFIPLADHVLTVVEEARDAVTAMGVRPEKVSVVSNTPDVAVVEACRISNNRPNAWRDKIILFYHGYVNRARGLESVLRCIPSILQQVPNLLFVIAGDGDGLTDFRTLANDLGIASSMEFLGWIQFSEIPNYISMADICIVPHQPTAHKNTTIPNKLFDYMAAGKPVIVSNAVPLRRIVLEEECGVVFDANVDESLREAVGLLARSRLDRTRLGKNGWDAVDRRYNWCRDTGILLEVIDRFVAEKG
ncbi:MAG: glycosyltransferase family 4 protein [Deltaproteobacteria bacterium]|nr:glycosyltransferase family 4 protein [Deltaproteobacteria bacterium]